MTAPTTTHKPGLNDRALRVLELFLLDAEGFRLAIATYDYPEARDCAIDALRGRLEARGVSLAHLDFRKDPRERDLRRYLAEHLRSLKATSDQRLAIMLVGLEATLDYSETDTEIASEMLANMNVQREQLPQVCPFPIVLWLSRLATSALARTAPDFWDWRLATFSFEREVPGWESMDVAVVGTAWDKRDARTFSPPDPASIAAVLRTVQSYGPAVGPIGPIGVLGPLISALAAVSGQATPKQRAAEALLRMEAGIDHLRSQSYVEAIGSFEQALEIARSLSDVRAEAQILGLFGAVYRAQGNREQAITFFKQSREGARRAQDRRAELTALESLGEIFVDQEAEPALNVLEVALTISRELRDRHAEIRILSQLGVALLGLTESAKAVEQFELALALAREVSDRNAEGQLLNNLGASHRAAGDLFLAVKVYNKALALVREIGDRRVEAQVLANLGAAYALLGEPDRARQRFAESLEQARRLGLPEMAAKGAWNLGLVHAQAGEVARAAELMQELVDYESAQGVPSAVEHARLLETLRRKASVQTGGA